MQNNLEFTQKELRSQEIRIHSKAVVMFNQQPIIDNVKDVYFNVIICNEH